jgi:glutamate-1-semialdehyde aminotransferase
VFDEAFFSFTFGGDMLGIAAATAVLDVLESEPVLEDVSVLGQKLLDGIDELIALHGLRDNVSLSGYPARHFINFQGDGADGLLLKSLFQQEAMKHGILAAGWHAPSWAHAEADVDQTVTAYDLVFRDLGAWIGEGSLSDRLAGDMVRAVFRAP